MHGETDQSVPLSLNLCPLTVARTTELVEVARLMVTLTVPRPFKVPVDIKVTMRAIRALEATRVNSLPLGDSPTRMANSNRHMAKVVINRAHMANRPTETNSRTATVGIMADQSILDHHLMAATPMANPLTVHQSLTGRDTARLPTAILRLVKEDRLLTTRDSTVDQEVTANKTRASIDPPTEPDRRSTATLMVPLLPIIPTIPLLMADQGMEETIPATMALLVGIGTELSEWRTDSKRTTTTCTSRSRGEMNNCEYIMCVFFPDWRMCLQFADDEQTCWSHFVSLSRAA